MSLTANSMQIAPVPQTSAEGLPFAPMISTNDALVKFFTMSADTISRRHRAFSHQVFLFGNLGDVKLANAFFFSFLFH